MAKVQNTNTEEKIGLQQRVSLGMISLTLGVVCLSLAVALYIAPSGLAPRLFLAAPGTVNVSASSATAVTLTWTAPGDDGATGQATTYDIRYSTAPITDVNFSSASQVSSPPSPQVAGSTETYTVSNLQPSTTYFFALKTRDEVGNTSAISNVTSKTTSAIAQACVPVYSCSDWSACTNSTQTRTCTVTNGCAAGLDQPVTSQTCTMPVVTPGGTGGGTTPPSRLAKRVLVAGTGRGVNPIVRFIDPANSRVYREFRPFATNDRNGVRVAVGDLNGDRKADVVVATSAPSNPLVRLFNDQGKFITQFNPYPTLKRTGVSLAMADVSGDGKDDLITIPDNATGQVRIYTYNATSKRFTLYTQFQVLSNLYRGGYSIAAKDLNLNGGAEIIVAPKVNSSTVYVYSVTNKTPRRLISFRAYPITFRTGLVLSAGDVNADGRPEILTSGGPGYYADVKAFSLQGKMFAHFLPSSTTFFGGVDLASIDINSDGRDEVLTITASGGTAGLRIFRYNGGNKVFDRIRSTTVFPTTMRAGARLGGA